jgi:DNA-binding HxlR family transcriptional regulator
MIDYGQFCPVSKTAQIIGEKWTLLIIRELLRGASRFNQIQRAMPRISPTVLNKRLNELLEHGVIDRCRIPEQRGYDYQLTECGRELAPLVMQMAEWGMRWARSRMKDDELDVELLMGDICKRISPNGLPGRRAVIRFKFTDLQRYAEWWIKVKKDDIDLCMDDPGSEVDVYFTSDLRTLTEVWMGDLSLQNAQDGGQLQIVGAAPVLRNIKSWFPLHLFAKVRPNESTQSTPLPLNK